MVSPKAKIELTRVTRLTLSGSFEGQEEEMMSVAVTDHEPSQLMQTLTDAEHQSGCVPDEALASIMAAEVAEEFREFLLVIASQPRC